MHCNYLKENSGIVSSDVFCMQMQMNILSAVILHLAVWMDLFSDFMEYNQSTLCKTFNVAHKIPSKFSSLMISQRKKGDGS